MDTFNTPPLKLSTIVVIMEIIIQYYLLLFFISLVLFHFCPERNNKKKMKQLLSTQSMGEGVFSIEAQFVMKHTHPQRSLRCNVSLTLPDGIMSDETSVGQK